MKRKAMRFQGDIPTTPEAYGAISAAEMPELIARRRMDPVDIAQALNINGPRGGSPEIELRIAILEQAIDEARRRPVKGAVDYYRREAQRWIAAEDDEWAFSFVSICGALRLDPSAARRAIMAVAQLRRVR